MVWYAFLIKARRLSDVVIDEHGISRSQADRVIKKLLWEEIGQISVEPTATVFWASTASTTYIFLPKMEQPRRLGIVLHSSIEYLPELLTVLNRYISQFSIPVLDRRDGMEVRLSQLPIRPN